MRLESPAMAESEPGRDFGLWAGCLAGPIAWAVQLEATYALSPQYCGAKGRVGLHVVSLLCLGVVAAGAWFSWREWGAAGRAWPSPSDEGVVARSRFLGVLGLLTCVMSAVVLLAQWVAVCVLDPCPL